MSLPYCMATSSMNEVRVAVPWLDDALASARETGLPALPALAWLIGRGGRAGGDARDWRSWLIGSERTAADSFSHTQAGPCAAVLAGLDPATAPAWALAQPVHHATGLDHLRLAPLAAATLDEPAGAILAHVFDAHFAERGFTVAARLHGAWLLRCEESVECATHDPLDVVGHNVHDFMPSGPHGAKVRSLINETQM